MTVSQYFTTVGDEHDAGVFHRHVIAAFEEVALFATTDDVSLNDVLRLVGQRLCELLRVSRCSVYLRRNDGRFQGQVGYCIGRRIDAGVSKLVVGVDVDRFSAEIIETGKPVLIEDAAHDPRAIQRTMRKWGVRSMLGVPLVVDGEVIGLIFADNESVPHEYDERDIQLAQAFAGLSALAVRQSWLYQQVADRMKVIDDQRRVLGATTMVHNRVTRAVLDGAQTDEILELIVELLGKPVVLYSPRFEVVSWAAPADLGIGCPGLSPAQFELPWVRKAVASLHNGSITTILRASPETKCRRLMVRMVADGQCAGYLELCEIGHPFVTVDSKALAQASMAVALKLLADQRNRELQRQEREEYFADALYGRRDLDWLTRRAEAFGIDLTKPYVVLRAQYGDKRGEEAAIGQRRLRGAAAVISRHLADSGRVVASTSIPGADLILVKLPADAACTSDSPLGQALRGAIPALADEFELRFLVVSAACRSLADLPPAAHRLRETADLLMEADESRVVSFVPELDLVRLIASRAGIDGARQFADDLLRPLVEHDEAKGGALLETLAAFAQCQAQIRPTAAMLAVHENTVRYRLSLIKKVSSVEPERLSSLLNVTIALQLRSLFAPEARGDVVTAAPGEIASGDAAQRDAGEFHKDAAAGPHP